MDEKPKTQPSPIDLSSLDGLTLGTAWTPGAKKDPQDFQDRQDRGPRRFNDNRGDRSPGMGRPPGRFGQGAPRNDPRGGNDRGPRRDFRQGDAQRDFRPAAPVPPSVNVTFYPEEAPLKALVKALKASKRTYELFEIARLLLEKPERSSATLAHKQNNPDGKPSPLYQCIADEAVFLTETEALQHACKTSLEKFYKIEEVEVEAPKGNFPVVHRCGITQKLIAPPNYHRYAQLLAEHQAKNLPNMTLPAIQARIESIKEADVIAQWVESMKKIARYTLLSPTEGQPSTFDGPDAAMAHLAQNFKAQLIKPQPQVRLSGKQVETLPSGEIKRSIEVSRAMQMKFPLETANSLRGRIRRIGFNIYKRGTKGVSYLCAVKRRFRTEGQTFAPEVQRVLEFIEKTPNITDADLPKQLLGITVPVPTPAKDLVAEGEATVPAAPAATLSPEEDTALRQMRQTLHWLIEQGYVIQYGNGVLFVPPPRPANAPKEEGEEEAAAEPEGKAEPATETSAAEPSAEVAPAAEEKPAQS